MAENGDGRAPMNLAQTMLANPGIPPLEIQMQQACEAAISEALKKYGCQLIFRQELINGLPRGGGFAVVRNPPSPPAS